jgi:hypothetical protein
MEYWSDGVDKSSRLSSRMIDAKKINLPQAYAPQTQIILQNHYSTTPLLHYSTTPLLHYSTTPILQYSNTPILQYPNTPILQYSNTPLLHCSIAPLLHCSIAPLLHCSVTPLLRYSVSTFGVESPCGRADARIGRYQFLEPSCRGESI